MLEAVFNDLDTTAMNWKELMPKEADTTEEDAAKTMILDTHKKLAMIATAVVILILIGVAVAGWFSGNIEIAQGAGATAVAAAIVASHLRGEAIQAATTTKDDAGAAAGAASAEANGITDDANAVRDAMAANDTDVTNSSLEDLVKKDIKGDSSNG